MRTTKEVRDWLEAAARANGRSLAQEVEHQLERARADESTYGGPVLAAFFRMMAAAGSLTNARTGRSWEDHYETFLAAEVAWNRLWEEFKQRVRPRPSPEAIAAVQELGPLPEFPEAPAVPRPTEEELRPKAYDPEQLPTRGLLSSGTLSGAFASRFSSLNGAQSAARLWAEFDDKVAPIDAQVKRSKKALERASEYFEAYRRTGSNVAQAIGAESSPNGPDD
jgi:hypothetical protein